MVHNHLYHLHVCTVLLILARSMTAWHDCRRGRASGAKQEFHNLLLFSQGREASWELSSALCSEQSVDSREAAGEPTPLPSTLVSVPSILVTFLVPVQLHSFSTACHCLALVLPSDCSEEFIKTVEKTSEIEVRGAEVAPLSNRHSPSETEPFDNQFSLTKVKY